MKRTLTAGTQNIGNSGLVADKATPFARQAADHH